MITICTPTYNRGHLLKRLYQSFCKQKYKDFEWVIVDDGSTDATENVVSSLVLEHNNVQDGFPIRYFKKVNGGKHTAINTGVKYAEGELFFIADSDDLLPEDSLLIVYEEWSKIKHDESFLGICGIDADMNGKIIGSGLPKDYIDCHAWNYHLFIMLLVISKKFLGQKCYASFLSPRSKERSSVQRYLYGFEWHAIIK